MRKIFKGNKIKVSDLSVNTTLDDLASMLESKDFVIDTDIITDKDIAVFNRETTDYVNDLQNVRNSDLIKITDEFYTTVKNQIKLILKNKNYEELRSLLATPQKRGYLQEIKTSLSTYQTLDTTDSVIKEAQKLSEDAEYQQSHSEAVVVNILQAKIMLEKMVDNLVDISKDPNNKQNLQRAFYYDKILTYWDTYIKDARKTINTIDRSLARSEFGKIFDSMNQEIKSGKRYNC